MILFMWPYVWDASESSNNTAFESNASMGNVCTSPYRSLNSPYYKFFSYDLMPH